MKTSSAKAKGRRLQVQVAEAFSKAFGLTIEAVPPTKSGRRSSGAVYFPEGAGADLRVRRMGEAGADVALLTQRARSVVSYRDEPFRIECKNVEGWTLDRMFQSGKLAPVVREGWKQACAGAHPDRSLPLLVVGRNHTSPIAVARLEIKTLPSDCPYFALEHLMFLPLARFVELLRGKE